MYPRVMKTSTTARRKPQISQLNVTKKLSFRSPTVVFINMFLDFSYSLLEEQKSKSSFMPLDLKWYM